MSDDYVGKVFIGGAILAVVLILAWFSYCGSSDNTGNSSTIAKGIVFISVIGLIVVGYFFKTKVWPGLTSSPTTRMMDSGTTEPLTESRNLS